MATLRVPSLGMAAVAALALLAACGDTTEPTAPSLSPLADLDTVVNPLDTLVYGGEQEYEDIARQVPGYAGHWFDDNGDRVVMLTDLSQSALAQRAIDARPRPEQTVGETRTGQTRFVQAAHSWATLRDWRNLANSPVLDTKGAVYIDADEIANRLRIGVVDATAQAAVQSQLSKLSIPASGVIFDVTGKTAEFHQTLQNFFRPLQGGYQTQAVAPAFCSLGPPVPGFPGPQAYYTASHCTAAFWANTGTNVYQHVINPPFLVGPEVADPAGWACGGGWVCRWSDVARVNVAGGTPAANQIARTTGFAINWAAGSINTAGVPAFNVINPPQWWPLANQWVDKVGRTTGWNRGQVTHTCVNVNTPPIPAFRRVMCQYYSRYGSATGDSGAPVFLQVAGGARVTGVNWGAIYLGPVLGWRAIFSPSGAIAGDGL